MDQAQKLREEVARAGRSALDVLTKEETLDTDHLLGLVVFFAGGAVALGKKPDDILQYLSETLGKSPELRA